MNDRIHSFNNDVLGDYDAVEIASLIRKKEINPKELIEATITRAHKINHQINAIVYEKSLNDIKNNVNGFFAGVPIYFKEITLVKGMPAHYGSEAFEGAKPAKKTDPIAKQILSMGFVNMGTSSMPEFGFTCSTEFPNLENTLNPWNLKYTAGGSSGGAAALVASGIVPIAHSADGGGSIRIPAASCGLIGLKPSRDRLLMSSAFDKQAVKISTDGVITRSVRDTA